MRTDAFSSTDDAMMLRAVPPWMRPMVTTAELIGAISRLTIGLHLIDELRGADDRIDGEVRMRAVSRRCP